ncbi:flagellar basal-body MS-ring/collar protein FliF [Devosia nitrariae]|uniref:Flagellar M-ring protein n=1 Tax=Devosia nitrariae TaxID=2071872 RepID=A0ABQ5W9H6_9HYPH|nr:flagellar basal-body MS-ring/collar protein FliF [Devosia nitrariae]GLQ56691.1 flagellar M-ring protein [Devosia nitrariae]
MATVAVLMLGFFAFLVMRASTPSLAPLYSELSIEDSSAIVAELQAQNIPYELRGTGDTILVPRDQITTLRMQLAGEGLPTRGQVGYEIFDDQNTLGATSFVQGINNVRALEGELARTITSLARIQAARVHLVLPERELFRRERKDPSASIVLTVRGELTAGEIRAVQHLVASAIEGLTPNRVAIVDGAGRLLAAGTGDDRNGVIAGEAAELTLAHENRLRTRLEDMLANVVGPGRARVEVTAELDMNRSTTTSEIFDPESQVVRSSQLREEANSATGPGSQQVSVADELPGASENATADGATSEQGSTTEEVTNYEISRTTETAVTEAGGIKRLSVAVVVDGVYADNGNGVSTYQPRSNEDIERIATLVRSAIGYSETRGDTVEVINMQFAERRDLEVGTSEPGLLDFTRDDLVRFAEMAVTLLIALALVLFIMRPLLKRVLAPEPQPLALPPGAELGHNHMAGANGELLPEIPEEPRDKTPAWVANARSMGETQLQTLKTVGTLVEENPKQAALIVRGWLNDAA